MSSQTMVDVPVGAVLPYAGAVDAHARERLRQLGWLVCDGATLYQSEHRELFDVIGRSYGYPKGREKDPGVFCLPDYRGMFLRGLDPSGQFDPEVQKRTSANPDGTGNTGAAVGSRQGEAIQEHEHEYTTAYTTSVPSPLVSSATLGTIYPAPPPSPPTPPASVPLLSGVTNTAETVVSKSSTDQPDIVETRPVNIAVNFIIKFRGAATAPPSCCADDEDTAPSSF